MTAIPDQKALETLSAKIARLFSDSGLRLAVAESCTGGWVGQCLTAIPGSSAWFDRGFICYSNQAKHEMLAVPDETLERHGAVSEPVAAAMAVGALRHSRADWAVSITGIAGPLGGTAEKPIGTVCFGWANRQRCETETCHFEPPSLAAREAVRAVSVLHALSGLLARALS